MSAQWPIPKAAAPPAMVGADGPATEAPAQPLLPLAFNEHVQVIKSGGAVDAFARRRAGQMVTKGHTPDSDLKQPPGLLAREAKWRLNAFLDVMGPNRMNLPPERRAELMRRVESAGAMLIALWDRLQVEVPDE